MQRRSRAVGLFGLLALVALGWPGPPLQGESPTEYEVKAAFLYNFAKFVTWPEHAFADPDAPLVIGVLGDDPFGPVLDRTVAGKTVETRPLVVKRLGGDDRLDGCHILFVAASERDRLDRILERLGSASVLTVSDVGGFAHAGGMINLVLEEAKVRFEVNVAAAERSRLTISSRLLALARLVGAGEQASGRR